MKMIDTMKYIKFMILKNNIDDNFDKYIKPLNRKNIQYGYYVYIDGIKAVLGGVHIPLEESKNNAIQFLAELKNRLATQLVAGNSLELSTTTSIQKFILGTWLIAEPNGNKVERLDNPQGYFLSPL